MSDENYTFIDLCDRCALELGADSLSVVSEHGICEECGDDGMIRPYKVTDPEYEL